MRTFLSLFCAAAVTLLAYNFSNAANKPAAPAGPPSCSASTASEEKFGCQAMVSAPSEEKPGCHAAAAGEKPGCQAGAEGSSGCCMKTVSAPAASQPTASGEKLVDVKNTKCIVTEEDVSDATFVHEGKIYHICCAGCVDDFNKDPKKYIKALKDNPAKFGIK